MVKAQPIAASQQIIVRQSGQVHINIWNGKFQVLNITAQSHKTNSFRTDIA